MDSHEVCFRILKAESEREVDEIVASVPELHGVSNWYPVDGRDTNFNVVTNQASTGSKALTELCTNMVDAVLMKYAHQKGIDVTGPDAPQSVVAGVRDLVQLRGARSGVLAEVDDPKYLQEFAERNLIIGVTGGTRRNESLCFTFVDNGEGQHPGDFEDTFLSLSKGSKSNIPFVQGKYNMGRKLRNSGPARAMAGIVQLCDELRLSVLAVSGLVFGLSDALRGCVLLASGAFQFAPAVRFAALCSTLPAGWGSLSVVFC